MSYFILTPNRGWGFSLARTLTLMVPFDVLASLGMDIYLPAVPRILDVFSASQLMIYLTLTLYMLMLGCGQIVFGPLSDRYGRRPLLLLSILIFVISSVSLPLSGSIEVFIILRLSQSMGASAMLVATFATVRDVYGDKPEQAKLYALYPMDLKLLRGGEGVNPPELRDAK